MPLYSFQLAAGHNNAAGLANVETTFGAPFWPLVVWDRGVRFERADSQITRVGFLAFDWQLDVLTFAQRALLSTTYCAGGDSGLVTVRSWIPAMDGTYANYNGTIQLPDPKEAGPTIAAWQNALLRFTQVAAL